MHSREQVEGLSYLSAIWSRQMRSSGFEPELAVWKTAVLPLTLRTPDALFYTQGDAPTLIWTETNSFEDYRAVRYTIEAIGTEGVEPTSPRRKRGILPLDYVPVVGIAGIEPAQELIQGF